MAVQTRSLLAPTLLLVAGLTAGYYLGSSGQPVTKATQPSATTTQEVAQAAPVAPVAPVDKPAKPVTPPAAFVPIGETRYTAENRLGSNLFIATSAEYRACCLQIYNFAARRLEQILAQGRPARPAVIFDLDETVLDNSAFQTALYAAGSEYQQHLWDEYEKNHPDQTRLVPGAKGFIDLCHRLGVSPVYISNRSEPFRASTVKALELLGINIENIDERLLLKAEGGSSDKASRREHAAVKFNVVMVFGDNLRDFSESFTAPKVDPASGVAGIRAAIEKRWQLTDEASCHWGYDWFVIPNPVYGEWDKLISRDPKQFLTPTTMVLPKAEAKPTSDAAASKDKPMDSKKPELAPTPSKNGKLPFTVVEQ